jgi:hypothetical protein
MKQQYTFKQIKEHIGELPAIKFEGLTKADVGKKLSSFLLHFFEYNTTRNTVYTNGKLQCKAGCRRSITDIYKITSYYFPRVMMITVYRAVIAHIAAGTALSAICHATKMRVYRGVKKGYEKAYFNGEPIDEYTVDLQKVTGFGECPREIGSWGVGDKVDKLSLIKL